MVPMGKIDSALNHYNCIR